MILIPAHNEEGALGGVLEGLALHAPSEKIIVVDSFCTDRTVAVAESFDVTVIKASERGYWNALSCGYDYALRADVEYLIQLDADGQHPPSAVPRLLHQIIANPTLDWVIGSRAGTGTYTPFDRRLVQGVFSRWLEQNTQHRFGDISSGLWGLNRRALEVLSRYPHQTADVLIRLYGLQEGLRFKEIPVPMLERKSGQSMHSRLTALKYALTLYRECKKFS